MFLNACRALHVKTDLVTEERVSLSHSLHSVLMSPRLLYMEITGKFIHTKRTLKQNSFASFLNCSNMNEFSHSNEK